MSFSSFFRTIFSKLRGAIIILARRGFAEFQTKFLPLAIETLGEILASAPGKSFAQLEEEFFLRMKQKLGASVPDNWIKGLWVWAVEHFKGKSSPDSVQLTS